MLLRYQSLGGHGSQCALPPACFDVLNAHLGVHLECFASPLNSRYDKFCSAFGDVDGPFGSLGTFFGRSFASGSYEANPPFEPKTLLAAVEHAERLLAAAEAAGRPLSFAFVVPTWPQLPFYRRLTVSKWLRGPAGSALQLAAASHAFVDGAQHLKQSEGERYRVSSFDSTVGVLQTAAGARAWPVDEAVYEALRGAFGAARPSKEAEAARVAKGGSDAVAQLLKRRRKETTTREGQHATREQEKVAGGDAGASVAAHGATEWKERGGGGGKERAGGARGGKEEKRGKASGKGASLDDKKRKRPRTDG